MQTTTRYGRPAVLPGLFLRYVTGDITEASWNAFMDALDTCDASRQEREAFARFYNDALSDLGPDAVRVPKLDELSDLIRTTRLS